MPPPPPVDELIMDDREALHSMLIAWYMSGYHTGYYQVSDPNITLTLTWQNICTMYRYWVCVCGRPYSSSDKSSEIKVMVAVEVVTRALNMNDS